VTFRRGDPAHLPFPDESFDVVTSTGAVHHFPSPSQAISEMARVCAAGGRLAI